jgi:toxin HigB-1
MYRGSCGRRHGRPLLVTPRRGDLSGIRRRSQVVRQESAKLPFIGSIPIGASAHVTGSPPLGGAARLRARRLVAIIEVVIIHAVIHSFAERSTEDLFDGRDTARVRRCCPIGLWAVARRKLDQLNRVRSLDELRIPPGNRLERLSRDRAGQHSIRINDQYRICFRWEDGDAYDVEVTDYH